MRLNANNKKAFTLIELLVVVAIIGLLATLSAGALGEARSRSRDAKRVSNIKQIHTALELYFNEKGSYPTSTSGIEDYMKNIPTAPTPPDGSCTANQNSYTYNQDLNGDSYHLTYCLGRSVGRLNGGVGTMTPLGFQSDGGAPCTANCVGKTCGPDGCGGSCGSCDAGYYCDAGTCRSSCVSDCDKLGYECGFDSCGYSCGECREERRCVSGHCIECAPDCRGRECGPDGCSGSCGECNEGQKCNKDGHCE